MTTKQRIQKLKAQLAKLEQSEKLVPTGRYFVAVKEGKKTIHTFLEPDLKSAHLRRSEMWVLLVRKMKNNYSISMRREFKKAA